MKSLKKPLIQHGFTAVELLVTIVVAAIFLIAVSTLYMNVTQAHAEARNRATANDLAYSYLRKYASAGGTPTWFVCSTASGSSNTNDLTINSNAAGQVLTSGSLTSSEAKLPPPVTYTVHALAIYGCSGLNINKPIRVDATVTYGAQSLSIRHSTIVGY